MNFRKAAIRAGLEALFFSGAYRAFRPLSAGVGAIFTLHHVRPARVGAFQPNRGLEIEPQFLELFIELLRKKNVEIVSLDEVHRRLANHDYPGPFAAFTLDDGYRDNLEHAWPVLKRHDAPASLFIASSFPDKLGELWWVSLQRVIAGSERLVIEVNGKSRFVDCSNASAKCKAFNEIYWWLRSFADESELRRVVNDLCQRYGVDPLGASKDLCMDWKEIASIAADPLISIGAHSVNHYMLKKWPASTLENELKQSAKVIEAALGKKPLDFAYPVGDPTSAGPREFAAAKAAGYRLAVTTRPGVIYPEHREHMHALPRVSLNGEFQALRYAEVLRSGLPFALQSGFKRVNAA